MSTRRPDWRPSPVMLGVRSRRIFFPLGLRTRGGFEKTAGSNFTVTEASATIRYQAHPDFGVSRRRQLASLEASATSWLHWRRGSLRLTGGRESVTIEA